LCHRARAVIFYAERTRALQNGPRLLISQYFFESAPARLYSTVRRVNEKHSRYNLPDQQYLHTTEVAAAYQRHN
jgi:hypothetical protein